MSAHEPSFHRRSSTPRRSREVALFGVLLFAVSAWHAVRAAPEDSYEETANCIAVMEVNADALAKQVKAGDQQREPALRTELVRAAAIVGRTYLDGMHDERVAKAHLVAARERQKTWDQARRDSVHGACLKRADAELAASSGLERVLIDRVADHRMQRMLSEQ